MFLRYLFLLILLTTFSPITRAQDVWLQNHFSPNSGCSLTTLETVTVLVNNNSPVIMPSNTIQVYYRVDGGTIVNQPLSSNLTAGASWNFSFSVKADLSACGSHTLKVWVARAGDLNQLNDTLFWTVQNDCPIVPGTVTSDITVCQGANAGTLSLSGWSYGTITGWESSTNGGTTWTPVAPVVTAPSYAYNNVPQTTQYHVLIDGGYCPDDTSGYATVSVQAPPIPGTLAGSDSLCENMANGTITLSGNTQPVLQWEYSTDSGGTWTTDAGNTTTTYNFSGLTSTTIYRVLVDGAICSDAYSDTAMIYVDPVYPPTVLAGSDSLCITNASGFVSATGTFGSVLNWEFSNDGLIWNSASNQTGSLAYTNLTQTRYFRMITEGGHCPDVVSDTAIIYVQPLPVQPTIGLSDTVCAASVVGVLNMTGATTPVLNWDASTDGGNTWSNIGNPATSYDYSGQTLTTLYRALLDGGFCPDYYSDTAIIKLDTAPIVGVLNQSGSACEFTSEDLHLVGSIADSLFWQYSIDNGVTWQTIADSDTIDYNTFAITQDVQFQAVALNGVCPPAISNQVTITMLPSPVADAGADTAIYLDETVTLNGSGGITGIWMPGSTLSDSTITNPVATPPVTMAYGYYVIDANGCIGSDTVVITVMDPIQFNIRNVITMNKDNFNDTWNITGVEFFPMTAVKVFNQYGKILYENEDYQNDWDGSFNGSKLPNGTYYYVVLKGGTEEEYKGTITLLGNE